MSAPAVILPLLLSLAVIEGTSYWWMHPAPAGLGEPVLIYRPENRGQGPRDSSQQDAKDPAQTSSSNQKSIIDDHQSSIASSPLSASQDFSAPASTHTPLPDVVARALPSLHCSTGTAARIDSNDGVTIHVAFFEWDLSSSTSVLEAYKHLPEECMGSIGLTLIEKAPPRSYVVRSRGTGARGQESEGGSREEAAALANSSSSDPKSKIQNPKLPQSDETLTFDHTVFRDPAGVAVHAFKGTWVSGASGLIGKGFRGGVDQWTQLRWKAGLKRFRPAHARVAQGAVRGIHDPDFAWQAFENAMLKDLRMENRQGP